MEKRVTIIPDDNLVIVGGEARIFDFSIDSNYHAIQWDGEAGFIETKVGDNIALLDLSEFNDILSTHEEMLLAERDASLAYENDPQRLVEYLSEYREQKVVEGITFGGLPIGGDDKTMLRVAGARIKADADPTFTTKWNGVAPLEATAIIAISDKLLSHVDKCFDAYGAVDLTGLTTKEQVEAAFDAAYEAL